jgi:adenylylsulfate kinase
LAHTLAKKLYQEQYQVTVLDGDNVRHGLCGDLGFNDYDRIENIRRVGEVCKLFVEAGIITLAAFVSPFSHDRERVRALLRDGDFIEVYVKCDLEICEKRDVKGIYKKARAGEVKNFTGIDSPYEEPISPNIIINTNELRLDDSVKLILQYLKNKRIFN